MDAPQYAMKSLTKSVETSYGRVGSDVIHFYLIIDRIALRSRETMCLVSSFCQSVVSWLDHLTGELKQTN